MVCFITGWPPLVRLDSNACFFLRCFALLCFSVLCLSRSSCASSFSSLRCSAFACATGFIHGSSAAGKEPASTTSAKIGSLITKRLVVRRSEEIFRKLLPNITFKPSMDAYKYRMRLGARPGHRNLQLFTKSKYNPFVIYTV